MAYPQYMEFRQNSGYVTTISGDDVETFEDIFGGGNYPRTSAQGNTVGWESGSGSLSTRDRNASNNARLAGIARSNGGISTSPCVYRMDITAGNWQTRIASGDASYAVDSQVAWYDTNSLVATLCTGSTSASQRFKDANNTEYTNSTWPGSNTPRAGTFSTSIARWRVNPSASSGSVCVNFIGMESGSTTVTGSGALTLDALTASGSGSVTRKGTGATTLDSLQVSGSGFRAANGAGALTLLPVEVAGSGSVGAVVTGSGAIELDALTVSGSGFRSAIGSGSIVLQALEASGAGVVEGVTIGSGSIALPVLGVSGQGFRTATGTGSILLPILEVLGFGAGAEGDQDILARDSRRRGRVMLIFGRG